MALALATARFYCMNMGRRSEALTAHPCGRGPGVGWRNILITLKILSRGFTHVTTSGPVATAFIQAVRVLAAITRDKKDTFRILLEFEEPK